MFSVLFAVLGVVTTGLAGSASAATLYPCGSGGDYCTYATTNVGVYTLVHGGRKIYTIPQGAIVEITCWVQSDGDGVHGDEIWYNAKRPGYTWGWVQGYYLATGHDPASVVGFCS